MILFEEFEIDPAAYDKAKRFWEELLHPIVEWRGWLQPWFPDALKGPNLYGDGIFSAKDPNKGKGFLLHQRSVMSAPWSFASYADVWDPDHEAVDVIHVQTVLAVRNIPRVYQLLEMWSDPAILSDRMASILDQSDKAGWPSDWAHQFQP
jgi:hypothetical protein